MMLVKLDILLVILMILIIIIKLCLTKAKTKVNCSETDFLISEIKKTFYYLQKTFIIVLILHYFEWKYHIYIKTDLSIFFINKILSQVILDQSFSNHITYRGFNINFLKFSNIC